MDDIIDSIRAALNADTGKAAVAPLTRWLSRNTEVEEMLRQNPGIPARNRDRLAVERARNDAAWEHSVRLALRGGYHAAFALIISAEVVIPVLMWSWLFNWIKNDLTPIH